MYIKKQKITNLPMVYVTAELFLSGKRYLAAVSEAKNEKAYIIDPETGDYAKLWQGDTGVMNVIQVPGREQLLAIIRFYPIFQSREAAVCLLEPGPDGYMSPWKLHEVLPLPFCHRIGIVENPNGIFVLGCQLCRDKDFQEDWTKPGALWMSPIPQHPEGDWNFTKLFDGLTKNHGLFIEQKNQIYICAENGILYFDLRSYHEGDKCFPKLLTTTPTSDIFIEEINDEKLAAVIEPFHGDTAAVYRLSNHSCEKLLQYPIHFGHVVWIGKLFGRNSLIVGSRGKNEELEIIDIENGKRQIIESGVGPTQISVYQEPDAIKILSANHGSGEVTLYTLTQ